MFFCCRSKTNGRGKQNVFHTSHKMSQYKFSLVNTSNKPSPSFMTKTAQEMIKTTVPTKTTPRSKVASQHPTKHCVQSVVNKQMVGGTKPTTNVSSTATGQGMNKKQNILQTAPSGMERKSSSIHLAKKCVKTASIRHYDERLNEQSDTEMPVAASSTAIDEYGQDDRLCRAEYSNFEIVPSGMERSASTQTKTCVKTAPTQDYLNRSSNFEKVLKKKCDTKVTCVPQAVINASAVDCNFLKDETCIPTVCLKEGISYIEVLVTEVDTGSEFYCVLTSGLRDLDKMRCEMK